MISLELIKTAALLHDIGKPISWASGRPWSEHIYHTCEILKKVLGEEYASTAMRHHSGSSYPEKYHPKNVEEKIIWIADNLSSGADRREMPEGGTIRPRSPFRLTHPLSRGDKDVFCLDADELRLCSEKIVGALGKAATNFSKAPEQGYLRIYEALEHSDLRSLPADTRPPINDVSLWHHSKLTAAFATCILMDGGWKGDDPSNYTFTVLSGDGDRISTYIQESKRIPDLNARSERVKLATSRAAEKIEGLVGPECLLFAGGGSLLALCPSTIADKVSGEVAAAFEEAMDGEASFTVNLVKDSGDRIQNIFGEVWKKAGIDLRIRKLEKPRKIPEPMEADVALCDICHRRAATNTDMERVLSIDASPRFEVLCELCWKLRESGRGVWVEDLTKETNYIAVMKADGDDIGLVLDGTRLKELDKAVTPSRLSTLSSLINDTCEDELRRGIESREGSVIFAGGDDILAILPGEIALDAAIELSVGFREAMNERCTMSAGIAIVHKHLPIYVGLERAHELISAAKKRPGKNGVAYSVVGGLSGKGDDVDRTLSWNELDQVLGIIDFFKRSGLPKSQIRRIAKASTEDPGKAGFWLKYLIGREVIPWERGDELLHHLESGRLADAFNLYNLFKVE